MNKSIYGIIGAAVLTLASCSKELPFDEPNEGFGSFKRSALDVSVNTSENLVRSASVDVNDVMVSFFEEGKTAPCVTYRYGDMEEIVTLPVGTYTVEATYGDNPVAAWDSPYYAGSSKQFAIEADKVTTEIEPIVCVLSNVKVSILFDESLAAVMGADSKVSVQVGESGSLDFTPADADRQGYFRYVPNTDPGSTETLAATFSGTVQGAVVVETKTYDNVAPGNHYRITFRLHAHEDSFGSVGAGVTVDASLETEDINGNVTPEDELLEDDSRPNQGGVDPEPGPGIDPTPGDGPEIVVNEPLKIDEVNDVVSGMECVLTITSETGIIGFTVDIDSPTLTPDELVGVGLAQHLDLVNPGDLEEGLSGLGFPVNVGGMKECEFPLTDFLDLLNVLGPGVHTFKLTVTDASGTRVENFKLRTL